MRYLIELLPKAFDQTKTPINYRYIQGSDAKKKMSLKDRNRKRKIIIKVFQTDECFPVSSYKAISKFFNPAKFS